MTLQFPKTGLMPLWMLSLSLPARLVSGQACGVVSRADCGRCGEGCSGWYLFGCWWGKYCKTCSFYESVCGNCGQGVCNTETCGCMCYAGFYGAQCTDQDCLVTEFRTDGVCSEPHCGGGTMTYTRQIEHGASGQGAPCPTLVAYERCNTDPCPTPRCLHGVNVRETGECDATCYGTWQGPLCNISTVGHLGQNISGLMAPATPLPLGSQTSDVPFQTQSDAPAFPVVKTSDGLLMSVDDPIWCVGRQSISCKAGSSFGMPVIATPCKPDQVQQQWNSAALLADLGFPFVTFRVDNATNVICAVPDRPDETDGSPLPPGNLVVPFTLLERWPGGINAGITEVLQLKHQSGDNEWIQADLVYQWWVQNYLAGSWETTLALTQHLCNTQFHRDSCIFAESLLQAQGRILPVLPLKDDLLKATITQLLTIAQTGADRQVQKMFQERKVKQIKDNLAMINENIAEVGQKISSVVKSDLLQGMVHSLHQLAAEASRAQEQIMAMWNELSKVTDEQRHHSIWIDIANYLTHEVLPFCVKEALPALGSLFGVPPQITSAVISIIPGGQPSISGLLQIGGSVYDALLAKSKSQYPAMPPNPFRELIPQAIQVEAQVANLANGNSNAGPPHEYMMKLVDAENSLATLFATCENLRCQLPMGALRMRVDSIKPLVVHYAYLQTQKLMLMSEANLQDWVLQHLGNEKEVPRQVALIQAATLLAERLALQVFHSLKDPSDLNPLIGDNITSPEVLNQYSQNADDLFMLDAQTSVAQLQLLVNHWKKQRSPMNFAIDIQNCGMTEDLFGSFRNGLPMVLNVDHPEKPHYEDMRVRDVQVQLAFDGGKCNANQTVLDIRITKSPISSYFSEGKWWMFTLPKKTFSSVIFLDKQETLFRPSTDTDEDEVLVSVYNVWSIQLAASSQNALLHCPITAMRVVFSTVTRGACEGTGCSSTMFKWLTEHIVQENDVDAPFEFQCPMTSTPTTTPTPGITDTATYTKTGPVKIGKTKDDQLEKEDKDSSIMKPIRPLRDEDNHLVPIIAGPTTGGAFCVAILIGFIVYLCLRARRRRFTERDSFSDIGLGDQAIEIRTIPISDEKPSSDKLRNGGDKGKKYHPESDTALQSEISAFDKGPQIEELDG